MTVAKSLPHLLQKVRKLLIPKLFLSYSCILDKNYIHYDDIAEGGVLKFEMGSQPNKERCTSKYAAPFSLSKE